LCNSLNNLTFHKEFKKIPFHHNILSIKVINPISLYDILTIFFNVKVISNRLPFISFRSQLKLLISNRLCYWFSFPPIFGIWAKFCCLSPRGQFSNFLDHSLCSCFLSINSSLLILFLIAHLYTNTALHSLFSRDYCCEDYQKLLPNQKRTKVIKYSQSKSHWLKD